MTISFRSRVFFNNFLQKNISRLIFKNRSYVSKTTPKIFLSAAKGAVPNSGSDSSLLFLFRNGCGSAAIKFNK